MKLVTLSCNNCGSPIELRRRRRFIDCPYCNVSLKVEVSRDAIYTRLRDVVHETADRFDQSADRLAGAGRELNSHLRVLRAENALLEFDDAWQRRLDELAPYKNGRRSVPTKWGAAMITVTAFFSAVGTMLTVPGKAGRLAVLAIPIAGIMTIWQWHKAAEYQRCYAKYVRKRRALLARIRRAQERFDRLDRN